MSRYLFFISTIFFTCCRQQYFAPVKPEETNILVVQGFINADGHTLITLSRTTLLTDTMQIFEANAKVAIESENQELFPLLYTDSGRYVSDSLHLRDDIGYRLNIVTGNGKSYHSDFSRKIITPPVDSITFTRPNNGIDIHVNALGGDGSTMYYKYNYEETWEINSDYHTYVGYRISFSEPSPLMTAYWYDSVDFSWNKKMFYCWNYRKSSAIKLGTTEKLSENRVYFPLIHYDQGAVELSVLYYVKVTQQSISKGAYEFLEKMRKNSESIGTTFDPQPSEIKGNIHSVMNPDEQVVGYIDVTTATQQSAFIYNNQLPSWNYDSGCAPEIFVDGDPVTLIWSAGRATTQYAQGKFFAAEKNCVDCTLRGSNIKPDFWPW